MTISSLSVSLKLDGMPQATVTYRSEPSSGACGTTSALEKDLIKIIQDCESSIRFLTTLSTGSLRNRASRAIHG